ncbi:hypothetical protein A2442_02860 [Candidatus Campbellbacteria bacterium RIFOXYC2_FULL_35_25]|uniref:Probable endolytic peptidoglycan transglycosylase RlpA n=1 Tax=Candidatus Campbellbacteria bacterium RIFOXYC2_FULL_35_25 TaxID=1797582 RepID=A0A1F5EJ38_9BACT|nr:MAG: hypothetical protein A2442_02860 [Candidatus Campbellbacteria bacterium RIFOXYC2_FULL_35_25]
MNKAKKIFFVLIGAVLLITAGDRALSHLNRENISSAFARGKILALFVSEEVLPFFTHSETFEFSSRGKTQAFFSLGDLLPLFTQYGYGNFSSRTSAWFAFRKAHPRRSLQEILHSRAYPKRSNREVQYSKNYPAEVEEEAWDDNPSDENVINPAELKKRPHEVASWYGPGFYWKQTASGKWYNPKDSFAAHRTAPLGSKVKVTNKLNGESVVVEILDRGPFTTDGKGRYTRDIDLTRAAALKIDMIPEGIVPVEITFLN